MSYTIYVLQDPEGTAVHYVGLTSSPRIRYLSHLGPHGSNKLLMAWIKSIRDRGKWPIMLHLVDGIQSSRIALDIEKREIAKYKAINPALFNVSHAVPVGQFRKSRKGLPNVYWAARRREALSGSPVSPQ